MDEHAGRVQHAPERRPARARELGERRLDQRRRDHRPPGSPRAPARARSAPPRPRARAARPRAARRGAARRPTAGRGGSRGECRKRARAGARQRRRGAPRRPRARASWSIFSGRTPAAMFVTTEIPRQRMPMCRAAMHLLHGRHAREVAADRAHEADLGRRLELRARARRRTRPRRARCPSRRPPRARARAAPGRTRRSCPGSAARARRRSGPTSGDVPCRFTWSEISTSCPGRKSALIAARGVRHHERSDPEPPEHAHAEHHAIGADSLVEVRPAAHHHDRHAVERPEHQHARVADRRRDRPAGDLRVRDLDRVLELVGEPAEPAPEDDADARLELRLLPDPRRPRSSRLTPSPPRRRAS